MICKYVRDDKGNRCGVVVAIGPGCVGWSLCHTNKDRFSREIGKRIAAGRAESGTEAKIPNTPAGCKIPELFDELNNRSYRYYKTGHTQD
jgi:hypothetical protein